MIISVLCPLRSDRSRPFSVQATYCNLGHHRYESFLMRMALAVLSRSVAPSLILADVLFGDQKGWNQYRILRRPLTVQHGVAELDRTLGHPVGRLGGRRRNQRI